MALTRYELGARVIAFLDPPATGPTASQLLWVLSDINGGLTEISQEAPNTLFTARRSTGRLGSSTALTVTATQDSEILTLATPGNWQDRMVGCAMLVAGDPRINRVEQLVLVAATGTIVVTGIPNDGDIVTIDGIVYRWKTAIAQPYDLLISATVTDCRDNLLSAIIYSLYTPAPSTAYDIRYWGFGASVHPTVSAAPVPATQGTTASLTLTAKTAGTGGNSIAISRTGTALTVPATLTGGEQDQMRLEFPFIGTTGSVTATVYYESWSLRSDEKDVSGPVLFETLADGTRTKLKPFAGGWEEWQEQQQQNVDFITGSATPTAYRVEENQSFLGTGVNRHFVTPTKWLRLSRWPSEPGSVSYTAKLHAPQFVLSDIYLATGTAYGNALLPSGLPEGWDDMVLLPIVMWRMLAWLSFPETAQSAQESIRTGIHEKYKRALAFLRAQKAQTETTDEMSAG